MFRKQLFFAALLASLLASSSAHAGLSFELLHAPCWTGSEANIERDDGVFGMYRNSVDCYNKDFNGAGSRTLLSLKVFQPWEFGSVFLYYDITGPFTSAVANTLSNNEKGGFFGGITIAVSAMQIGQKITGKPFQWGPINDLSFKYEMEHVSKFGMLHYYGLQWGISVPFMDFLVITTVLRNDTAFEGLDLQLGGAWQKSFSILSQDFVFAGFLQVGVFGEGAGRGFLTGTKGNRFLSTQPQLMWDFGKLVQFTPGKLYAGFEWQFNINRYLIEGKTENTLQGMFHWNL